MLKSIALSQPPSRRAGGSVDHLGAGLLPVFVVGKENATVLNVVSPAQIEHLEAISPILIHGAAAVGKTAIAHTIAARWLKQFDQKTVTITAGADFARQFAHAIQADDMDHFRRRHRECNLLVLDGLHDLVGKTAAQEELLYTLDWLAEHDAPVVVTASKLPGLIRGLKSQLTSRLMGGLSLHLLPPGKEARTEILRLLAEQTGVELPTKELHRLAHGLPPSTTARQLQNILAQWLHQQRMDPESQSDAALEQILVSQAQTQIPTIHAIAKEVAKRTGLKLSDLRDQSRKANIVRARGLAMFLSRRLTEHSLQHIGEFFGGRDHTTVMHACRKTETDLDHDVELLRIAEEISQKV